MDKYKRINIDLDILSPKSVMEIFSFINDCFENSLDLKYFKKNLLEFNTQEQFFICYYLKKYTTNNLESYLNIYVKKINDDYLSFNNSFSIDDTIELIYINVDKIRNYIELNYKTLKRQTKLIHKDSKHFQFIDKPYNYRIPLFFNAPKYEVLKDIYINKDDFREQIAVLFNGVIPKTQFEEFFNNSFHYKGNISDIKLLNIEFVNSRDIYSSFHELYSIYSKARNHYAKSIKVSFDKATKDKIKEITFSNNSDFRKTQLISLLPKRPVIEIVKLFDIMVIMYNTFPQIRESSIKYLQDNPQATLEKYLLTKSRNIKSFS